jgi:hypothetical protein
MNLTRANWRPPSTLKADAGFYANPYPTYRALRETEPVKRLPNGSYS